MAKTMNHLALALLIVPGLGLAECYRADESSGRLEFIGEAEGSRFSGQFGAFEVSLCLDEGDLSTGRIEVTVDTGSADTGNRQRDRELLGEHFFAVDQYPQARWQSGEIRADGDEFLARGELTLRGVTADQPVRLSLGDDQPPVLVGSAEIMRMDWRVGSGDPDFEDTDFIRNRVDLRFELELTPAGDGS